MPRRRAVPQAVRICSRAHQIEADPCRGVLPNVHRSTGNQHPRPTDACRAVCRTHGYELIGESRMRESAAEPTGDPPSISKDDRRRCVAAISAIIVWDLSRLGRTTLSKGILDETPSRCRREGRHARPRRESTGRFWRKNSVGAYQQEGKHAFLRAWRVELPRNTRRAKRGERMSAAPYGYRKKDVGMWPGDRDKILTVRRIFRAYRQGNGNATDCVECSMRKESSHRPVFLMVAKRPSMDSFTIARIVVILYSIRTRRGAIFASAVRSGRGQSRERRRRAIPEADLIVCKGTHNRCRPGRRSMPFKSV